MANIMQIENYPLERLLEREGQNKADRPNAHLFKSIIQSRIYYNCGKMYRIGSESRVPERYGQPDDYTALAQLYNAGLIHRAQNGLITLTPSGEWVIKYFKKVKILVF